MSVFTDLGIRMRARLVVQSAEKVGARSIIDKTQKIANLSPVHNVLVEREKCGWNVHIVVRVRKIEADTFLPRSEVATFAISTV